MRRGPRDGSRPVWPTGIGRSQGPEAWAGAVTGTARPGASEHGSVGSYRVSMLLLVTLVGGLVATLQLTDSPPYAVYQHVRDPAEWYTRTHWVAVLVVQSIVCFVASVPLRLTRWLTRLAATLGPLRWAGVLLMLAFSLAVPRVSVPRFAVEVVAAGWFTAWGLLNIILVVAWLPPTAFAGMISNVRQRVTLHPNDATSRAWDARFPWWVSAWVLVSTAGIAWFVFDGVPHIDDSIAYLFQAKTMATGALAVGAPADPEAFAVTHLVLSGDQWFSKFFPGWPALLSIGVRLGIPWVVNPLLAALTVLVTHALLRRLYSRGTANLVVCLMAVSPWFLFMSGELMSHPAALLVSMVALLCIDLQRDRRLGWPAVGAGLALGALYLIRPFDAALLGAAAALWAWGLFGKRLSLPALLTICVTSLAVASLSLVYNQVLTGDPLTTPHHQWAEVLFGPGSDVFGFGRTVGIPLWRNADPLEGHGLADVVLNANKNFFLLHTDLLGWLGGSLVLAGLGAATANRADRFMLLVPAIVIGCHSFYWAPGGPDLGARYWYLILVPLLVLTVRGIAFLLQHISEARVSAFLCLSVATALVGFIPWRAVTKYHRYRDIGGEVRAVLPPTAGQRPALVFVRAVQRSDYQSAFNFNTPTLDGPAPVFVLDRGEPSRSEVARRYADREVWLIGRPHPEQTTLVVLQGPLPPGVTPSGNASAGEASLQAVIPRRPLVPNATR